ncbi:unnamed protein product [Cylindrotheca closterium]|uniref:Uncharacterized protein n=1 Tax=Cylindrotheca closterium TaxID=2856 RepID=A0AAD2JLK4_9STRA|nr:unnamed protein product [Cylindrotheca closterium]
MTPLLDPYVIRILLVVGALGAILLFVADLILYYPFNPQDRTAKSYFDKIDPGGSFLADSSMKMISRERVMLGGVLGPVSAVLYGVGFVGLFCGLYSSDGGGWIMPLTSSLGFTFLMTVAAVYHALFAYTSFLSQQIAKAKKENDNGRGLEELVDIHRTYLKYIYKWCAIPGALGSLSFIYCCLFTNCLFAPWTVLFAPAFSAFLKKHLKRNSIGGLVLCGGLTNLWNLCFFSVLIISISAHCRVVIVQHSQ